jgi:hypothetical protein
LTVLTAAHFDEPFFVLHSMNDKWRNFYKTTYNVWPITTGFYAIFYKGVTKLTTTYQVSLQTKKGSRSYKVAAGSKQEALVLVRAVSESKQPILFIREDKVNPLPYGRVVKQA